MMTDMGKENNVKVYWASTTHNRMVGFRLFTKNSKICSKIFIMTMKIQFFLPKRLKLTLKCDVTENYRNCIFMRKKFETHPCEIFDFRPRVMI